MLKACDTYLHSASDSHGWAGSEACRLIEVIRTAAIRHLPGYAEAPATWQHPSTNPLIVGLRRTWTPVHTPVHWLDPVAFAASWPMAHQILITADALADVPLGLNRRAGVSLLTGDSVTERQWQLVARLPITTVVMCPIGLTWLLPRISSERSA